MPLKRSRALMFLFACLLLSMGCMSDRLLATQTPTTLPTATQSPAPTRAYLANTPFYAATLPPTQTPIPISNTSVKLDPYNARRLVEASRISVGMPERIIWSADGSQVGAITANGLNVYDTFSLELQSAYMIQPPERALDYSLSAGLLASTSDYRSIQIKTLDSQETLFVIQPRQNFLDVFFSPDGSLLAIPASGRFNVEMWDIAETAPFGNYEAYFDNGALVFRVQFTRDGKYLAWIAGDQVQLMNLQGGKFSSPFRHQGSVSDVALAPYRSLLAASTSMMLGDEYEGVLHLWNPVSLKDLGVITLAKGRGSSMAFSQDGRLLAAGTGNAIQLWITESWEMLLLLEGHQARINDLSFSPDERTLVSLSSDGTMRFWQAVTLDEAPGDYPFVPGTWVVAEYRSSPNPLVSAEEASAWIGQEMQIGVAQIGFIGSICQLKSIESRAADTNDFFRERYRLDPAAVNIQQKVIQVITTRCQEPLDILLGLSQEQLVLNWKGIFFFLERQKEN